MAKGIANRNTAKYNIERQYICFFHSELNFSWNESDVDRFIVLWEEGMSLKEAAKTFGRHPFEVGFLYMSLAEEERVERRATEIIFSDCG